MRSQRMLTRSWKGGRNPDGTIKSVSHPFTLRLRWYKGTDDVRLSIEDEEGVFNHIFTGENRETEAEQVWQDFRAGRINAQRKEVKW